MVMIAPASSAGQEVRTVLIHAKSIPEVRRPLGWKLCLLFAEGGQHVCLAILRNHEIEARSITHGWNVVSTLELRYPDLCDIAKGLGIEELCCGLSAECCREDLLVVGAHKV